MPSTTVYDGGVEDATFHPVSRKLIKARLIASLPPLIILFAAFTGLAIWAHSVMRVVFAILAGVMFVMILFDLWIVPIAVKRTAWAETDTEFMIRKRGRFLYRMSVIPYGRIQYVNVTAGPIQTNLGITSLELSTASASDSSIDGLPLDVAEELRTRLSAKAREQMSPL